jgi:hypothetical protein
MIHGEHFCVMLFFPITIPFLKWGGGLNNPHKFPLHSIQEGVTGCFPVVQSVESERAHVTLRKT